MNLVSAFDNFTYFCIMLCFCFFVSVSFCLFFLVLCRSIPGAQQVSMSWFPLVRGLKGVCSEETGETVLLCGQFMD